MAHIKVGEGRSSATTGEILSADAFQRHLACLRNAPGWVARLKKEQRERFDELPLPVRTDEKWRFSNTRNLSLDGFELANEGCAIEKSSLLDISPYSAKSAGRLIFADDQLILEEAPTKELLGKGVIWTSLKKAFSREGDLLQSFLMKWTPDLGSEKFQALHGAFLSNGTLLYVPKGVEIELPFIIRHWGCNDGVALFPHTLVIAEDNARVTLVDYFENRVADTRHFVCGLASIIAGRGSQVFYKAVQDWNLNTLSFHLNSVTAKRDSNVKTVMLNLGSRQTRNEHHTRIVGEGSNVESYSLSIPTGTQEFDQRTLQTHSAPHARSDVLYKNALMEDSRTIFSGLIHVDRIAQQTDAYQTNRNLLLSDTAEANSLPGLEILANDVKCSHGATTGKLDADQLYYLLARGIHRPVAQQLLVFGFLEEIIDKLDNEQLRDNVRILIQQKLRK